MLEKNDLSKADLIKLLQNARIQKIFGKDVHAAADIAMIKAQIEKLRGSGNVTVFVVGI